MFSEFKYVTAISRSILILIAFSIFSTCSEDTSTSPESDELEDARVVITPQTASFEAGSQKEFLVHVITTSGDTVNQEYGFDWNWYSDKPEVFTVQNNGTATGKEPGEANCIVEVSLASGKEIAKRKSIFVGRDSAFVAIF